MVSAEALSQATKGLTGIVQVGADAHRLSLVAAGRTVVIVQAATPEWATSAARLWSDRGGFVATPRAELVNAVATAKIALDRSVDPVLLAVSSRGLRVTSLANDRVDADTSVAADTDLIVGDDSALTIAFNATLLGEILAAFDTPTIRFDVDARTVKSSVMPVEIRGVDGDGAVVPGLTYMLVPIRVIGGAR